MKKYNLMNYKPCEEIQLLNLENSMAKSLYYKDIFTILRNTNIPEEEKVAYLILYLPETKSDLSKFLITIFNDFYQQSNDKFITYNDIIVLKNDKNIYYLIFQNKNRVKQYDNILNLFEGIFYSYLNINFRLSIK